MASKLTPHPTSHPTPRLTPHLTPHLTPLQTGCFRANPQLVERTKSISNLVMDRGSQHNFKVGDRPATITITRGRSAGFTYHLSVDNEEIERDIGISAAGLGTKTPL